ncbi:hypothetical protein I3842_Q084700 [Carya illinoinensis]|uniref:ATP-dependent DNA helicase n=1 Tax=Carya illinoinensis TaxID=32201 RepID=A0A922A117_CARIL|nr:hypothetical protein I3842_Q084700 [Carya illinoinensis]
MLYKDLSEEKKAEIRRKSRERYAQKKAAKSSLIGPINLEPSNIDQVITSIDGTSNDYQSQIWNAENYNFQQTQLKRCRISVINNNSDGISSLQGASISTDINLSMTDLDESTFSNSIKHQKRGFPHAHFLIILHRDWKLYAPESFDQIISAELPDKDKNLHLYTAVIKHMMHGPCGALNPTNVCMKKNGHCKNNYPRHFVPNTTIGNDCFPIYKRSDDGRTVKIRGHDLDNRWVVPYNPYLLAMFDCHINIEICSTIKAVKYLYKYIYKEAMWRIYGFIINEVHPAVYSLHLHLENQHQVTFRAHENLNNVISPNLSAKSMLTEFFSINQLFATILVYYNPTNPRYLWEHFKQDMSSDFQLTEDSQSNVRMQVLRSISMTLESMGRDINSFQLLDRNIHFDEDEFLSREIDDELAVFIPEEDITASTLLNREQQIVYNLVLEKIFSNQSAAFFIDGPGGTEKTFLYKALLATIRSRHLIALATTSSGVAASILPGGRTAHSRFKIPLDSNKNSICSVSKQSGLAKLLQITKLIIWDEAPMSRKEAIEALDRMLKDVNDSELSFGGKVVIFRGDFRQILPVVPKGTRQQQIDASLNDTTSLDQLLDAVFNDISEYSANISSMMNHAILTPKNSYVDEINNLLIQRFPGDIKQYYSFDETIDASEQAIMEDFLNTLTPNGFPPHQLLLKQNFPIMLLRNINPSEGLCNGTRLICRNFDHNIIHAEIAIGHQTGKKVFIPRIPFLPKSDENSGFPFKRTQFPIRLSFAMSINKSQGQTLDFVGIYLPQPVFSHGQLYVALSRAKTISAVKILIRPISMEEPENNSTKNIVYTELLSIAASD